MVAPFFLFTSLGLLAQESIVERERARRAANATEASKDLKRGDVAYQEADYAAAVTAYGAAREKFSGGTATAAMRAAATERLAQASVERARELNRLGKREEATTLLDTILDEEVAPDYAPALAMQEQILDPLRSNPALDAETVRDIDKVRRLLYEAEGFASLAQYDRASMIFEEVLRIDPFNSAARRGMDRVNAARSEYHQAAAGETRSRMLAAVDEAWGGELNPMVDLARLTSPEAESGMMRVSAREKLKTIIVPSIDLEGVDIYEAIEFLRQRAVELDSAFLSGGERGVGIVVDLGAGESEVAKKIARTRFDLKLSNVPLGKVLEYINAATSTQSRIDEFAVVIRPSGASSDDLLTRNFRVPPDFLSRESVNQQTQGANPFDDQGGTSDGMLGSRFTARQYFESQGVSFPEGASAAFRRNEGTLTVRNTPTNLDFIEQVVSSINGKEPVVVQVEVTFLSVGQDVLEELGYDVLLSPIGVTGEAFIGGGTIGSGTPIADAGFLGQAPLTAGNRSGDGTELVNTIDAAINRVRSGAASGSAVTGPAGSGGISGFNSGNQSVENFRAPGILNVSGFFNEGTASALMRGIQNKTGRDTLIKKSVFTRSGQTATVEATRRMPYPTEYEPPELPNSIGSTTATNLLTGESATATQSFATPATPTAFDVRKLGCILEVEPLVGPDRRYVELAVKPSLVDFDGFIDYGTPIVGGSSSINLDTFLSGGSGFGSGSFGEVTANNILMPVFSSTTTNTSVVLADGATLVMGGLLKSNRSKFEDSTPVLGNLPLIGRFFKSESETNVSTALLIFVKVRLLDPSGQPFSDR